MFVGVVAARVRDLFEQAKGKALASSSSTSWMRWAGERDGSDGSRRAGATLNQLLVEMDGFDPRIGVF